MGAYNNMTRILGNLVSVAEKLNYPQSSIAVLKGDIKTLQEQYSQTYRNLLSCSHNKDKRDFLRYGQDLVASWLFEDYLMWELYNAGLSIKSSATDRQREILPNLKISSSSDCEVSYEGKSVGLEIMNDYTGWWRKTKEIDLRDNKYNKIVETKSLFLGISNSDKLYILITDMASYQSSFIPSYRPYGNKPAYKIFITENDLKPIDFKEIAKQIKSILIKQEKP